MNCEYIQKISTNRNVYLSEVPQGKYAGSHQQSKKLNTVRTPRNPSMCLLILTPSLLSPNDHGPDFYGNHVLSFLYSFITLDRWFPTNDVLIYDFLTLRWCESNTSSRKLNFNFWSFPWLAMWGTIRSRDAGQQQWDDFA